jgi:hypothetical protein
MQQQGGLATVNTADIHMPHDAGWPLQLVGVPVAAADTSRFKSGEFPVQTGNGKGALQVMDKCMKKSRRRWTHEEFPANHSTNKFVYLYECVRIELFWNG